MGAVALGWPKSGIFASGLDLARTRYFCMKRSFTDSLRAQIWPKSAIFALGGFSTWGLSPLAAEIGDFRIKQLFTESLERPRAQIWPIFAISVFNAPLRRASKGPGPDLAKFGDFCIRRPFTESLERPGAGFGQIWLFLY